MSEINIIEPSFEIEHIDGMKILKNIERYGRICYKSEANITEDSAQKFVRNLIKRGHESVLEHEKVTIILTCDRGITHEIVRHRIASYSQESTRYCNYNNKGMSFIDIYNGMCLDPSHKDMKEEDEDKVREIWQNAMEDAKTAYNKMIECGASPQIARSVLPNSLKTEIVMTMNLREWRHFFRLRADMHAHPQMREITLKLLKAFQELIPVVFEDL